MKKPTLIITTLLLLQAVIQPVAAAEQPFSIQGELSVTRVSDGDSLRSGPLKIRLHGIDAPELKQTCADSTGAPWPCGRAARDAMAERSGGRRSVPEIFIDDRHIGGCDELHALERAGELDPLLAA